MRNLGEIVTANVKAAIKAQGSPSFYRLGREMAKVMIRPPGIGMEKHGPAVGPETCRRGLEESIRGARVWRLDFLEAVAYVLGTTVTELLSPPALGKDPH